MIDTYLEDKKNQFTKVVVPSSLGLADPTLNGLVDGYNKAQLERQSLLDGNVPPNNPLVKEAEGQIEKIRESLLENLKNIKSSYTSLINDLDRRNTAEQKQFESLPFKLKEYVEIQRQVNTKVAL